MRDISMYAEYEEGVDKWYLIGTTEGPDLIVNTTKVLNTGLSEFGYINKLTPPYKTKELLIEHQNILPKPCNECGGIISTKYIDSNILIERNLCFGCSLWTDRITDCKADSVMVVDHKMYSIADENPKISMRGFGGAKFTFLKDSKTITSTNVWFGGEIPKIFQDRIPDNAKIIKIN